MQLYIFAHSGVEHTNQVQTAVHAESSQASIIIAVSAVLVMCLLIALKLISKSADKENKQA